MNTVRVMSREEISRAQFRRPVAVISVRSRNGTEAALPIDGRVVAVLRLVFDDVEDPREGAAMTDEQARQSLAFAAKHVAAGHAIVCQCEAGVSRSAGLAAALSQIHYGHDGAFHRTHRPNAWVRRALLREAREQAEEADSVRPAPSTSARDERAGAVLLPTSLPDLVLVRDGLKYRWTPAHSRTYPPGTLGGDERTIAAHVFLSLRRPDGTKWDARAVGAFARQAIHVAPALAGAFVVTRAGAWHRASTGALSVAVEPGLEIYAQIVGDPPREAWTRAIREQCDALGRRYQQDRIDVALLQDGLMFRRLVWRPEGTVDRRA